MAKRKRIYRANPKAVYGDKEAKWIGLQIERAEAAGGMLDPVSLVALSKPSRSPGHGLFNWNIQEAAEAHWIERAQYHLRMLEIEIVYDGNKERIRATYPVMFNSGDTPIRSWSSYDQVQSVPDLARQVIDKAAAELKSWRDRYALYRNVFGPVFDSINQLENELCQSKQSTESRRTATQTAKPKAKKYQRPRKSK